MTDYGVLGNLLVIFSVSIAVVFMFHQFRLPSIAGFLVAGALIGPDVTVDGEIETDQISSRVLKDGDGEEIEPVPDTEGVIESFENMDPKTRAGKG